MTEALIDPIVTDEAVLRQVSRDTTFVEALSLKLFDRLQAAARRAWTGGVGAAAIQIGVPLRCAFYQIGARPVVFLINPVIVKGYNVVPSNGEGCLSIPGKRFNTWWYDKIEYTKVVQGEVRSFTAEGLEAHVIQHEVDHMNGVLCCDRTLKPAAPGRNEACACGSGKKYKNCCGGYML